MKKKLYVVWNKVNDKPATRGGGAKTIMVYDKESSAKRMANLGTIYHNKENLSVKTFEEVLEDE